MFSEHLYQSNVVHAYFFGRVVIVFHKIDIFFTKKMYSTRNKISSPRKAFSLTRKALEFIQREKNLKSMKFLSKVESPFSQESIERF